MTVKEIYEIIKQKKEEAELDKTRLDDKYFFYTGKVEAYEEILELLLESRDY